MSVRIAPRVPFAIAGLLLALFILNMGLRIARVKFGVDVWQVGDVGEFVLVLLCMVFFVAGLLVVEERNSRTAAHTNSLHPEAVHESNAKQGGVL
ncbi:MAG: hypothetical protein M3Z31_15355 [Pseudomonadota bacterium]|nr:hypothetical protein [Pseudomonadota bacterium]